MSAVSSESAPTDADLSAPSANPSTAGAGATESGTTSPGGADFGANEWLVDELYQRYLADPGSVDQAWWSFFADYRPTRGNGTGSNPAMPESGSAETLVEPPPTPRPSGPGAAPSAPTVSQPVSQPQPASQPQAQPQPQAASQPQAPPQPPAAPPPQAPAAPQPPAAPKPQAPAAPLPQDAELTKLRGAAARTAQNMAASLAVPTATS